VAEKQPLPTWQEITLPSASAPRAQGKVQGQGRGQGHSEVMYACFLVHAYLEKHCGDLAMQVRKYDVLVLYAPTASVSEWPLHVLAMPPSRILRCSGTIHVFTGAAGGGAAADAQLPRGTLAGTCFFVMPSDVDPRGLFVVTLRLFLSGQDLVV
jgi:hypothetical protein